MRYIKVFLLVLLFLLVMMFFVQNQTSFSDPVVLRFDLLFLPPLESMPLPLYVLMLCCFGIGAVVVLIMLLWDRIVIAGRLSLAKRTVSSLEKKGRKPAERFKQRDRSHEVCRGKISGRIAGGRAAGQRGTAHGWQQGCRLIPITLKTGYHEPE